MVLVVGRDRLNRDRRGLYVLSFACQVEPDDATARCEPEPSIGAFKRGVQGSQLKRKPWESFPHTIMVTLNEISRVLQGSIDFGTTDVKDATQAVEPEVPAGRFHNSGDSTKPLVIRRVDAMEASMVDLL